MALTDFFKNLGTQNTQQTNALQSFANNIFGKKTPTQNFNTTNNQVAVTQPQKPAGFYPQKPVNISQTIPATALQTPSQPLPDFDFAPTTSNLSSTFPVFGQTQQTEEKRTPTLQDTIKEKLEADLMGGGKIDMASAREQARFDEKKKLKTDLENSILQAQTAQMREIEKIQQEAGTTKAQKNATINQFQRDSDRRLADLAIRYKIANDDYQGVQQTLQAYEQDLKDQRDYEMKVMSMAMDFLRNDLSESEKMQIQQNFRLQEIDYENNLQSVQSQAQMAQQQAQAQPWVTAIANGQRTIDDVPKELQSAVLTSMQQTGVVDKQTQDKIVQATTRLDLMNEIFNSNLGLTVGSGLQNVLGSAAGFVFGQPEVKAKINQLIESITVGELEKMSGPLTDEDINVLRRAATALNRSGSEEAFKRELITMGQVIADATIKSPVATMQQKARALQNLYEMKFPNATDVEIAEMIDRALPPENTQSFNSAGNASASVDRFARAIAIQESGERYDALGPVVQSGQYKGERALGKYQIMPGNLPQWSMEIIGRVVTPQEFMQNPQLQDAIAKGKFQQLLAQYSPQDAASIWFSGRPLKGNTSKDVTGTNVPTYVQNVIRNLNNIG